MAIRAAVKAGRLAPKLLKRSSNCGITNNSSSVVTIKATAITAEGRRESRGAHSRVDYKARDDENWLCHSMYFPKEMRVGKRAVNLTPKTVSSFEPKERTY